MILTNWLEKNDYYTPTDKTPKPSHLSYTGHKGGKLYIPREHDYDFLKVYAEALKAGEKLYYVETRPVTFKFMVDLDISDTEYWNYPKIKEITIFIHKIVGDFFKYNGNVLCCTSPEKIKKGLIHTGIHLIWNNIFVNSETALCIRNGIVQKLKESFDSYDWNTIIDETIYTRVGFRMVGSDKMTNKIPENRPLSLLLIVDSDLTLNEAYYNRLMKDTKALILDTSIRYVIDAYINVGMEIDTIPSWLKEDAFHLKKRKMGSGTPGILMNSECHDIIEKFIRYNLPKAYSYGTVKEVTKYPDNNLLIKTKSKYCMNMDREHNSCGIYFIAVPHGLYQKCLCPCNKTNGRKNGLCMDYTSELFPFNENIQKILFPEYTVNPFLDKKKHMQKLKYNPNKNKNKNNTIQEKQINELFNDIMF